METQIAKAILRKKTELEESGSLTSHYTTKLQQSKQYGTGTKTEIKTTQTNKKQSNKQRIDYR